MIHSLYALLGALCVLFAGLRWRPRRAGTSRAPFGNSRFANGREIAAAGLLVADGILVGRLAGRELRLPGQRFVLVAAPTRSGKGVGIVVPNLLSFRGSALVLDIKQENFTLTAGWRAGCGQSVYLFNPFAEDLRSHRYNPLEAISADPHFRVGDILSIGQILYPDSDRDRFWNDQARNLFLGLVLYLCETPGLPRTLAQVLRTASGSGLPLRARLAEILGQRPQGAAALSPPCRDALARVLANGDAVFAGILAAFNAPLLVFANPVVDAATKCSDFSLAELRRAPMTIYLGVAPNRLADAARLLNLFVTQLVQLNTRALPAEERGEPLPCLLVLDEFTALGKMPAIVDAMPYLAAYNLRLLTVVQSLSQLVAVYGDATARTFATNHALQVLFAPRDQRDARDYSQMLGTFTQRRVSRSRSSSSVLGRASRAQHESVGARELLNAQEVKELGTRAEIILLENTKPILAEKIRYYDDPVLRKRVTAAPEIPRLFVTGSR